MDDAVAFAHFIWHILNVSVACASNKIISFLPTFTSLVVTTDDDINKFIATVHGENSGRALSQRIYIPVGVIMHLKALHFELDDRKFQILIYYN